MITISRARSTLLCGALLAALPVCAAGETASTPQLDFSEARSLPYLTPDQVLFENVKIGGAPYLVVLRAQSDRMVPLSKKRLTTAQIPFRAIAIDGDAADWSGVVPALTDPAGDEDPGYAGLPGTDLAAVYLARDATHLYVQMAFDDGAPAEDVLYVVEFQQYLTQLHTPGDRFVSAIKGSGAGEWTVNVHDRGMPGVVASYAGYASAGSRMVEWKAPIADLTWPEGTPSPYYPPAAPGPQGIENRFVRAYAHPHPGGVAGPVSDTNDQLARPLIVGFDP